MLYEEERMDRRSTIPSYPHDSGRRNGTLPGGDFKDYLRQDIQAVTQKALADAMVGARLRREVEKKSR